MKIMIIMVILIAIYLWVKYFLIILKSDNIKIVKLCLIVFLIVFPIAPFLFHMYKTFLGFLWKFTKEDFASGRAQKRAKTLGSVVGWLFKK
ncbi:MAG: hypothetical protein QX189_08310 [Methylococcales bacterium]